VVRLETNKALAEAISLYRSAGYHEVDAFNDEPYAHHWFEKQLVPIAPTGVEGVGTQTEVGRATSPSRADR
jgi:hypothetical protein